MISSFEENKAASNIYDIGGNKTKSLGCAELEVFVELKPDLPYTILHDRVKLYLRHIRIGFYY